MSDLVLIKANGAQAAEVAGKLLAAAGDDVAAVKTTSGGFVVPAALAKKAGVLEDSGPAAGAFDPVQTGATEAGSGFTTSTENGPSPEGRESDAGNATPEADEPAPKKAAASSKTAKTG